MKNQKGSVLIIIFVIIIIALLVVGGYFAYQYYAIQKSANESQIQGNQQNLNTQPQSNQQANNADIQTTNWKIYTNTEYDFEIKYPADWKINDQSYTYNGQAEKALEIESPINRNLVGYEAQGAIFSLQLDFTTGKAVVKYAGFIIYAPATQSVENISLSDSVLKNTTEYKIAQKIIDSAKIIK